MKKKNKKQTNKKQKQKKNKKKQVRQALLFFCLKILGKL